jgi:hypothetical protein
MRSPYHLEGGFPAPRFSLFILQSHYRKQQKSPQAVRQVPREGQRVTEEADEGW